MYIHTYIYIYIYIYIRKGAAAPRQASAAPPHRPTTRPLPASLRPPTFQAGHPCLPSPLHA